MNSEKTENQKNPTVKELKEVAFYEALINAWTNTRMEKDKQLLTLSSLGIGLIIIFQPKLICIAEFMFWIFSGLCFLACIILLLSVLSVNSDFIEAEIKEPDSLLHQKLNSQISIKTKWAGWLFIAGAIFAFSLAISQTNFIQIQNPKELIQNEQSKK